MKNCEQVHTGIGVIIVNPENKILVGKRKNSHAPYFSIAGGHLDPGETFEQAAIREIKEETNLDIKNPRVLCVTNNLKTFEECGRHYTSVILLAKTFTGELKNMEPHRCEGWEWVDPKNLPMPHFDASMQAIRCYLENKFYHVGALN